ncbi:MAG: iron ABC transporter permease, partial [Treponema sp.]|nr:iron ABC transporter permease [Treponema sp.]
MTHTGMENAEETNTYSQYIKRKWMALFFLAGILFLMTVLSLSMGSSRIPLSETISALFGGGEASSRIIIWNVRMPRIATAIAVGIVLAMAGCIMQNVLRNPLAAPATLGVSQGASFGAALAIAYFNAGIQIGTSTTHTLTITNPYMVTFFAFLGGIATTAVILGLSRIAKVTPSVMILAGVALSALFSGATTLVQYFADDLVVAAVVFWTFGSLGRTGWNEITLIFCLGIAAFLYFFFNRWNYNAMESGTNTAKSLGINVDTLILVSMTIAALISAVAVAFVGIINFVGLIAPHMVRKFVGN